jgi:hypothetical protein
MMLNVMPKILYRNKTFEMFRTKVFAAFDLLFSKENVFPPPSEAGKLEFIRFTYNRRISVVSILLAYETLHNLAVFR